MKDVKIIRNKFLIHKNENVFKKKKIGYNDEVDMASVKYGI